VPLARLRGSIDMPHDQLEDLLRHLEETGAVRRSRKGWALAGPREDAPS